MPPAKTVVAARVREIATILDIPLPSIMTSDLIWAEAVHMVAHGSLDILLHKHTTNAQIHDAIADWYPFAPNQGLTDRIATHRDVIIAKLVDIKTVVNIATDIPIHV